MDIKETLFALTTVTGVSGEEFPVGKVASDLLKSYSSNIKMDAFGNVVAFIGDNDTKKETLLLDAHIDEIGYIVTNMDKNGFIGVGKVGGSDLRQFVAQTVTIWGKYPIKGIVSTLPPHVRSDEDENSVVKITDVTIDTGFSKDELQDIVSLGDKVTVDSVPAELLNKKYTSKAIDDRSGMVAILYALELLKDKELKYNLVVQFASQEELGGRGAVISAYNVHPDYGIAVDVSFALTDGCNPKKCGIMGCGSMIGVSPSLDREISDELIALSQEFDIPYQIEVMAGNTGTNADDIGMSRNGVRMGLISIPEKYMHSSVEVVDEADIKAVGRLIAEFVSI